MKRVFIIHGWEATPEDDWYGWLKGELVSRGFEAHVPAMPNTDSPNINRWLDRIFKVVGTPDENTYFVGHSIGCQAIIRYLATLIDIHVAGVFCVAPWFQLQGLKTEEEQIIAKPWLETPVDFNKARNATSSLVAIFSDNDPFVPLDSNKIIFRDKLGAEIIVENKQGHFTAEDGVNELPVVLEQITKYS